ncbi:MAG TPA: hypothetical protein DEA96_17915 [Leptospiraceae bacterium]|nr:hypothetical protein [Spirochaetaceae bacterium]HBS06852.1 hypothetical protein [Leptospiraceae bacterium]
MWPFREPVTAVHSSQVLLPASFPLLSSSNLSNLERRVHFTFLKSIRHIEHEGSEDVYISGTQEKKRLIRASDVEQEVPRRGRR